MNKTSIILSALITITMVIMIAPSILRLNQGKVLRNAAIWLAIFLLLGLVYQNFGPNLTKHSVLENSDANAPANGEQSGSDQGYMPPKEE